MTTNAKICLACNRAIKGRLDKKFCDDNCRNNYNNRLNSDATPLIRNINNILRKNRRVLEQLLEEHKAKEEKKKIGNINSPLILPKAIIAGRGFDFFYFTQMYKTKKEEVYYYCYDYGYRKLEGNRLQVVKALPNLLEILEEQELNSWDPHRSPLTTHN